MNERPLPRNEKLSPVLERLRRKTIYSVKDFKSPQQILQRSLELGKYRDNDPDAFIRETTILFSGFGRTKKTSDINVNDLIATLFVLRDNPDKTKYRFPDSVKQGEISLLIDSLLGKNLDFISNKKDSSIILPAYLILRSLKEDHSWWTWNQILGNRIIRQQTIELKNNLLDSIHTKKSREMLKSRFKQSLDIDKQNQKIGPYLGLPLFLSQDYAEIQAIIDRAIGNNSKNHEEISDNNEIRSAFFRLSSIFKEKDYEKKAYENINSYFSKNINEKTKIKIIHSFKQSYSDILKNNESLKIALSEEFEKPGDFSNLDMMIGKILFKNYRDKNSNSESFKDFLKINEVKQAAEALRKIYLLFNINLALPSTKRDFIISPEYKSLISIEEVSEKLGGRNIKNFLETEKLQDFIDFNDEELVTHYLFLTIENQIINQQAKFNERKVTKIEQDRYLDIVPSFLDPLNNTNQINFSKLKIPIEPRFHFDKKDNHYVYLYSYNRLLTIIPIDNIAYR